MDFEDEENMELSLDEIEENDEESDDDIEEDDMGIVGEDDDAIDDEKY